MKETMQIKNLNSKLKEDLTNFIRESEKINKKTVKTFFKTKHPELLDNYIFENHNNNEYFFSAYYGDVEHEYVINVEIGEVN